MAAVLRWEVSLQGALLQGLSHKKTKHETQSKFSLSRSNAKPFLDSFSSLIHVTEVARSKNQGIFPDFGCNLGCATGFDVHLF